MRRALVVVAMTGLVLGLSATTASAHSLLTFSTPADGAALQSPPARVTMTFTEPPDPELSTVNVLGPSGAAVDTGPVQKAAGDPLTIQVALPAGLSNGVYTVTWRVVSEADGHLSAGSFAFGVGVVPTPGAGGGQEAPPETPPPSPVSVAGRWGLYWGLAILLGGSVGGTFVLRKIPPGQRAVFAAAWALAAIGLVAMILSRASTVGVGVGELLSSSAGRPLVAQAIALVVVGATVGWFLAAPRWTSLPAVGLATAAAMLAHAYSGHAGAPSSFRWLNVLVQWVHLLAVGVWVGGLVWLLLVLRSTEGAERIRAATRFSFTAAVALGAVALSGIQRAISEVGGVNAWLHLFATSFGVALFVKLVLFAALVALGSLNRYRNVPGLARGTRPVGSLVRTVSAELVVAVGIFGVTGVLTELPPAKTAGEVRPPAAAKPVVATGSDFATTMKAKLVANPGTIGINEFTVTLTDYDTGAPVEADIVSLAFTLVGNPDVAPTDLRLDPVKVGQWSGQGSALSIDGEWNVQVLVVQGSDSRTIELRLQPRPPEQDLTKVETPGAPTIYTITFPGGSSVQAYVEPGTSGSNEVHITYFDAAGNELPVDGLEVEARPLDGSLEPWKVRRFGPGHFVADGDADAGKWRFWMRATGELVAYFDQRIEG